jgi:PhoH-like ATPase
LTKHFVLDTNVIVHNPSSIKSFGDNTVVLPIDVIEELDRLKSDSTEVGRNARAAIRDLDQLRKTSNLRTGAKIEETGGTLYVDLDIPDVKAIGLHVDIPDNRILAVAYKLSAAGKTVIFVSKDMNSRIKANALGIEAMDFEKGKVDVDKLYCGWREMELPKDDIEKFFKESRINLSEPVNPNEFILFRKREVARHTVLARADSSGCAAFPMRYENASVMGITPRNLQQRMAMELLLDDEIKLVTLVGTAGTGKTLLALATGLKLVMKDSAYEKLLVSRPIMPLGRDIGFLPGTKEEKLENWMQPIHDNLKFIMHEKKEPGEATKRIQGLLASRLIELEAITYIRGRSIPNTFLVLDEAQNLTPHEMKTIVSRVGQGSKLVVTGDPDQIDNPYLDRASNGLTFSIERMRGQKLFGHVTFTKTERSELASLAAEIL